MSDSDSAALQEMLQFVYLTPVGIIKFEPDGTIDLINPAATRLLMPLLPGGRLTNVFDSLMPLNRDLRARVESFAGKAGEIVRQQRLEVRAGRDPMVLSLTVRRVNERVHMAVLEDVTSLVEQEKRLSAHEQRYQAILDNVREYAIFTLTLDGTIEDWNASLQRFGGWSAADVEGVDCGLFLPRPDSNPDGAPPPAALLHQARDLGSVELEGWISKRDGSVLWANVVVTVLPDETGVANGFVVVASNLTEHKRIEDNLTELATIDPLTGAFNRRQGMLSLLTEIERKKRSGLPFSVLMIDIDLFKAINDDHGHDAGDTVLCAMVECCKLSLRSIDIFVRWGGEEFLVILPGTASDGALGTAERLRSSVAALEVGVAAQKSIAFTISIGLAVPASDDVDELLRRADEALYLAKDGGRNRVVLAA